MRKASESGIDAEEEGDDVYNPVWKNAIQTAIDFDDLDNLAIAKNMHLSQLLYPYVQGLLGWLVCRWGEAGRRDLRCHPPLRYHHRNFAVGRRISSPRIAFWLESLSQGMFPCRQRMFPKRKCSRHVVDRTIYEVTRR